MLQYTGVLTSALVYPSCEYSQRKGLAAHITGGATGVPYLQEVVSPDTDHTLLRGTSHMT